MSRKPILHLPYLQLPPDDQLAWEHAIRCDDPFSDGAGGRLSQATQRRYLFTWRRFLGFLSRESPDTLALPAAERMTAERVRNFASHLAQTNMPRSVATQVGGLYNAVRLMMPDRDWDWLRSIKARLFAVAPPQSAHGPVITSDQLLRLGQQLMAEGQSVSMGKTKMAGAVMYRDGLMIALLACFPLRRKNNAAITIGRHLRQTGHNWMVVIPGAETKNGAEVEFEIPPFLSDDLRIYLNIVRPTLLRDRLSPALWITRRGTALAYSSIWQVFERHSLKRLGVRVSPHDVRDAAATTWAIAAPGQIGIARDLLGHAGLHHIKHYNRARGIEASRTYAGLVAGIRSGRRKKG